MLLQNQEFYINFLKVLKTEDSEKISLFILKEGEKFLLEEISRKDRVAILKKENNPTLKSLWEDIDIDDNVTVLHSLLMLDSKILEEVKNDLSYNLRDRFYDSLIYNKAQDKWLNSVSIFRSIKSRSRDSFDTTGLIPDILDHINMKVLKGDLTLKEISSEVLNDVYLIDNINSLAPSLKSSVIDSLDSDKIQKYISVDNNKGLYSLQKTNNLLINYSYYNHYVVNEIKKTFLLSGDNSKQNFFNMITTADTKKLDESVFDFLEQINDTYGKKELISFITRMNESDYLEYASNNIDAGNGVVFSFLLKNKCEKTLRYLVNNGYNPHERDMLLINDSVENDVIGFELLHDIKRKERALGLNIPYELLERTSDLASLNDFIKNNKLECQKFLDEDRLLKDKEVLHYYKDGKMPNKKFSLVLYFIKKEKPEVLNVLLENNITFSDKEIALIYIAFKNNKGDSDFINTMSKLTDNLSNMIDKRQKGFECLLKNIINDDAVISMIPGWGDNTSFFIDKLFKEIYPTLKRDVFLDLISEKNTHHLMSNFFLYDKLTEDDKKIFITNTKYKQESDFIGKMISSLAIVDYQENYKKYCFGKIHNLISDYPLETLLTYKKSCESYKSILSMEKAKHINELISIVDKKIITDSLSEHKMKPMSSKKRL